MFLERICTAEYTNKYILHNKFDKYLISFPKRNSLNQKCELIKKYMYLNLIFRENGNIEKIMNKEMNTVDKKKILIL